MFLYLKTMLKCRTEQMQKMSGLYE